jgi:hypothetical protein
VNTAEKAAAINTLRIADLPEHGASADRRDHLVRPYR